MTVRCTMMGFQEGLRGFYSGEKHHIPVMQAALAANARLCARREIPGPP